MQMHSLCQHVEKMLMGSHLCGDVIPQLPGAAWLHRVYKLLLHKSAFHHDITIQALRNPSPASLWWAELKPLQGCGLQCQCIPICMLLFPANNVIPVCAPLGFVCVPVCMCICLLVSPHLPCWTPFPNVGFLREKDRGLKAGILCCHVTLCCDKLRWPDVELAGESCSSRAGPVPSVSSRREQPVDWRMGEKVPGLPLFWGNWEAMGTYTGATQTF